MIRESPATTGGEGDAGDSTGELVMVLDLNRQGVSVSDIARRVGLDRKTVRRYLARGLEPPVYTPKVAAAADRRRTSTPPANSDTPRTGSSGLSASGRPVKP